MNVHEVKYVEMFRNVSQRLNELEALQTKGLICLDGDFVPSVHYPPITQYPNITEDELFESYTLPEDGLLDVYVHIPFCEQRCCFCHYPGKLGQQDEEKKRYLAALEKEMDIYLNKLGIEKIKARSILIGGGTPTFLEPEHLRHFLEFFCKRIDFTHCRQFNYDVDPGTLVGEKGIERLRIMKEFGVDRLTIGIQSLDDSVLKIMNRPHDSQTAIDSIINSKEFGFQVNIEFIYGHPGETIENWIEAMEKAVTLPVDEIQIYRLKVLAYGDLQGNIIKVRENNPSNIPTFTETMMMKQISIDILKEHGFNENLRRVYSKKKSHFSHYAYNQCCMLYDQIGFGLTAFSSFRDRFALNTPNFDEYYAMIEEGKLPLNRGYIRDKEQQLRWAIVLPLKNKDIQKKYFEKVTGVPFDNVFRKKVERLKQFGLITEDAKTVSLTELGSFVADEVVEQFNSNEFMPFASNAYNLGDLHPYMDNNTGDALGDDFMITEQIHVKENLDEWNVPKLSNSRLKELLTSTGSLQEELFEKARLVRQKHIGDTLKLRGVIEITNICQKNCDYCAMRCSNNSLERFNLEPEMILLAAKNIVDTGIETVFLQGGQCPKLDPILEEIIPEITNNLGAEVLLCIGDRDKETYNRFAKMGAKSYILKYESSDPVVHKAITHTELNSRIQCMNWIREAGMRIGTGNIVGLPGQTLESLVEDIRFAFEFNPDFVSSSPFIPNRGTPLENLPCGDIDLTLNTMALWRIGLKDVFIPTVSALEYIHPKGQLLGLNAGANVMTINFTPKTFRDNYAIYSKDRFIVSLAHATNTANAAGLKLLIKERV